MKFIISRNITCKKSKQNSCYEGKVIDNSNDKTLNDQFSKIIKPSIINRRFNLFLVRHQGLEPGTP